MVSHVGQSKSPRDRNATAGGNCNMSREFLEDIPLPSQTIRHLSIKAVFFSSEAVEFMTQRASIYRSTARTLKIPSPDNNIVQLQLIEEGGNFVVRQHATASRIDREVSTTFYTRAKTVQKWMDKASAESCLFVYVNEREHNQQEWNITSKNILDRCDRCHVAL